MNNQPVKVLYFVDRMLRGGIQSLVIDWVSKFDNKKVKVDFLLLDDGQEYELEETLKDIGCNVYKLKGIWINKLGDFIKYGKRLDAFFASHHDYKVVHLHSSSKNYQVLKYAKKYGIEIRIAHSHSIDFQTKNPVKKIIGNILKRPLIKYSTNFLACSKLAGEWLFGKKIVESKRFTIIHNAVAYDRFKYNNDIRNRIRNELNIQDYEIVMGHVGRFTNQKNHDFLIDIFYNYQLKIKNSKLLLVGTGVLEKKIKDKVKKLGIEDRVIFAGFKTNVNEYMQAMDLFVFPSLYEGLGLVLIEAQCSGLTCFTSDRVVPKEAQISDLVQFISLKEESKYWVDKISNTTIERRDVYSEIKEHKYLIQDVVEELEDIYIN